MRLDIWSSKAKQILKDALIKGYLDDVDALGPRFVYDLCMYLPEFHEENFNNYEAFVRRYRDLKKAVSKKKDRTLLEEQALVHDRAIYPIPMYNHRGEPYWEGSDAQK